MPKVKHIKEIERFEVYSKVKNLSDTFSSESETEAMAQQQQPEVQEPQQFLLSVNDVIKDAQRIHEFRGDNSYALTSFLREGEAILSLLSNCPDGKRYVYQRIIINKIQGPALDVIRTLGPDASWEQIKTALTNEFGVKETYHQLYQKAFSAKNFQVREYFLTLRNILARLNEKYEYDIQRPVEFSPRNNEAIILKTFINNIDPNLASIILNRNLNNLRDAFNTLETLGVIRDKTKINNNNQNNFTRSKNDNRNNNSNRSNTNNNYNQSNNNNTNNNYRQNFGQYRQNLGQYRQNSGQSRRHDNNSITNNSTRRNTNTNQNRSEPMEIDHVELEHEVNFQLASRKHTYQ